MTRPAGGASRAGRWARASAALLLAASIGSPARPAAGGPALAYDAVTQSVQASGLEPRLLAALAERLPDAPVLSRAFAVYLGDSPTPMLGDYEVSGDSLRFTPRLPFLAGRAHRAMLDLRLLPALAGRRPPPAGAVLQLAFQVAAPAPAARPRVTAVFPSSSVVPANLLRLYIHFSQPMARQDVARQVRLLDDRGNPVGHAFLEVPGGLWDPAGRRLTLLLHPGRIKRGLAMHEALGPALRPGRRYRLVVAAAATDEAGTPLGDELSKELSVAAADRRSPDVSRWLLQPPPAGSRQPLVVVADKPLDRPLFARLLRVEDAAGRQLPGRPEVEAGEMRWRFVPSAAWRDGRYLLRVGAALEDLAGNRPTRLFDEATAPGSGRAPARDVLVPFRIAAAPPPPLLGRRESGGAAPPAAPAPLPAAGSASAP